MTVVSKGPTYTMEVQLYITTEYSNDPDKYHPDIYHEWIISSYFLDGDVIETRETGHFRDVLAHHADKMEEEYNADISDLLTDLAYRSRVVQWVLAEIVDDWDYKSKAIEDYVYSIILPEEEYT